MDQIIIEHYNNSCNFLSLINFKIPFIVDNGLIFNKEQVYTNGLEEGILINRKEEGFWISWYENRQKNQKEIIKIDRKKDFGLISIKMEI